MIPNSLQQLQKDLKGYVIAILTSLIKANFVMLEHHQKHHLMENDLGSKISHKSKLVVPLKTDNYQTKLKPSI